MKLTPHIEKIKWYIPLELNHSSYIFTSLVRYCKKNDIKLKISFRNNNKRGKILVNNGVISYNNSYYPKLTWIEVKFKSSETKLMAFDLDDNPDIFSREGIEQADFYFKRCFQNKYILPVEHQFIKKIYSMGIPFMVRPERLKHRRQLKFLFYLFKAQEILKFDSEIKRRWKKFEAKTIQHFKVFSQTRTIVHFNDFPQNKLGNKIFYQKRLFNEEEKGIKNLNKTRVKIIKVLKDNFLDNFVGGLQENLISIKKYPTYISNIEGDQLSFLRAMQECGICIYTNGIAGSPGWTLPEFMSQGKAIIAEKLHNEIPFPLVHDKHLLFYETEQELIAFCYELLHDEDKRNYLGQNARKYYDQYINPDIFFEKCLKRI